MSDGIQGNTGSSAPDMPPLVRVPAPPHVHTQGDAVHLPFQRREEPSPSPAEELALLDVPLERVPPPVEDAQIVDEPLGPTGRPMPFIPEPTPARHATATPG